MYLLDTNHCSRIILGDEAVISRITQVGEAQIATCVVVQGELTYMMEKSQQKQANLERLAAFLEDLHLYLIDEVTATIYGQLKASVFNHFAPKDKSKRRSATIAELGFDDNDLWITAIALQHDLTIISTDSDFSRIQQAQFLTVESWIQG